MAKSAVSAAVAAAIKSDNEQPVSPDKLDKLRDELRRFRDLELENSSMAERIRENKELIRVIKEKTLVELFDECRVKNMGLLPEGNNPPFDVEVKPYYHANIADDWEDDRRAEAFAWLEKNRHGDLIKTTYVVAFGMGKDEEKRRKAFEKMMNGKKVPFNRKFGVPWNTLTAFVKEQVEEHKKTPPLALLGATVGRVASIIKPKKQRN